MRIVVNHVTEYRLDLHKGYAIQEVRLSPKNDAQQTVESWSVRIEGGALEAAFEDQHGNHTRLFTIAGDAETIRVLSEGVVETTDRAGVLGPHRGFAPLWLYRRRTALTEPGPRAQSIAAELAKDPAEPLERLHALNRAIADSIAYEIGRTDVGTTAEGALEAGKGVCQDHAHAFAACARTLGFPARYVSGYLAIDGSEQHEASHAWAEAHVEGLGWVGFDPANRQCPDERYVRLACGLDYAEAAPLRGLVVGGGSSAPIVTLQIQQ